MFKLIAEAPEYEIDENGKVRRVGKCQPLKPFKRGKYNAVRLNGRNWSIHRLVAMTHGERPENWETMDVDHIDYNTENNNINNLQWLTHLDNAKRQKKKNPEA